MLERFGMTSQESAKAFPPITMEKRKKELKTLTISHHLLARHNHTKTQGILQYDHLHRFELLMKSRKVSLINHVDA